MNTKNFIKLEKYVDTRLPIMRIVEKGPLTLSETKKASHAIDLFLEHGYERSHRSIFIINKNKQLKGVVTSTDLLNFLGAGEKFKEFKSKKLDTRITKIMTKSPNFLSKNLTLDRVLPLFRKDWYSSYPVLHDGEFRGVLHQWDMIKHIQNKTSLLTYQIMVRKPHVTRQEFTLFDTAKMMVRGAFNTLPVTHKGILTGFITPYEILTYLKKTNNLGKLKKLNDVKTESVMKRSILSVKPTDDISRVVSLMKVNGVSSLPVIHYDEIIGIINEKDIIDSTY